MTNETMVLGGFCLLSKFWEVKYMIFFVNVGYFLTKINFVFGLKKNDFALSPLFSYIQSTYMLLSYPKFDKQIFPYFQNFWCCLLRNWFWSAWLLWLIFHGLVWSVPQGLPGLAVLIGLVGSILVEMVYKVLFCLD